MKNNCLKISLATAALMTLTACTDLDVDIKSQYTEYPDTEIALEAQMADVFYAFRSQLGRRYNEMACLQSDEFTSLSYGSNWYDSGNYFHPSTHDLSADDACVGTWDDVSGGIVDCNQIIVTLGGEGEVDDAMIAQPLAMRAFYTFILMDEYGAVPIMDHVLEDDEVFDRSPRSEVAEFIESDLLRAIESGGLSQDVDASTYGKPNYWMAKALLAKLYINWAVYTCDDVADYDPDLTNSKLDDCIDICDEIIESGLFDLSDSYKDKFLPDNGYEIKDFIYVMPYDNSSAQGMTYARFRFPKDSKDDGNDGEGLFAIGEPFGANFGGIFAVLPEAADRFYLEGDDRNDMIIGGPVYKINLSSYTITDDPWLYNGEQVVLTHDITLEDGATVTDAGDDIEGHSQGYRSIKWMPQAVDYSTYSRNQSNDVPIFRYADIILTKAEALLRNGGSNTEAVSLFNQIRAYVNAPEFSGTLTLDDILEERGREFFDENWRRNDLIRFGNFEDDWGFKNTFNPGQATELWRRIAPIPTSVLNSNTNWSQNYGY